MTSQEQAALKIGNSSAYGKMGKPSLDPIFRACVEFEIEVMKSSRRLQRSIDEMSKSSLELDMIEIHNLMTDYARAYVEVTARRVVRDAVWDLIYNSGKFQTHPPVRRSFNVPVRAATAVERFM